jgi:hypothetical protein
MASVCGFRKVDTKEVADEYDGFSAGTCVCATQDITVLRPERLVGSREALTPEASEYRRSRGSDMPRVSLAAVLLAVFR